MHRRLLSKIWHPPFNLTISVSWKIFSEIWRKIPMAEEFINWNVYPFLSKKWCFIFHRLYRWSLQLVNSLGKISCMRRTKLDAAVGCSSWSFGPFESLLPEYGWVQKLVLVSFLPDPTLERFYERSLACT